MPLIDFECQECKHTFEDFTNAYNTPEEKCPSCGSTKLEKITTFSHHGKVELTGHELKAKIAEDTQKLRKEVYSSEAKYANLLGESKYEKVQQQLDRDRKERGRR